MMKIVFTSLGVAALFTVLTFAATQLTHTYALHGHALIAVLLGVFFTTAVGFWLMGLIFHSQRSGHDDAVQSAADV